MSTIFLALEQILIIHEDQIDRYGGSHGLRDLALLESAIYRPQTTFSGQELYSTVFDKASALLHSLVMNHPFIDGNKRTGAVSMIIFLGLNGIELKTDQDKLIEVILQVENKTLTIEQLSEWIKSHAQEI